MKDYQSYALEIQQLFGPQVIPIAVRMMRKAENIPEGVKRPRSDFKTCMSQCQAFALAERNRMSIAMQKEDQWCPSPVVAYGLEKPPQFFLDGGTAGHYFETLEAGRNWAVNTPRLEAGKYTGIMSAPLATSVFEPDLVLMFCDSFQLSRLLGAAYYKDGRELNFKLSANAACVYAIVPPMQTGQCQVCIPCAGARRFGGVQDDKMIFTVPIDKLDDLMVGLKHSGPVTPVQVGMHTEYALLDDYAKLANLMGMTWSDGSKITGKPANERTPWS